MKHTRRGFFATLLAAVAAPLLPKLKAKSAVLHTWPKPDAYPNFTWYYDEFVPVMELWPKPMTAARLVENALENIKALRPVPDPAAAFAELNAMLDKVGSP